MSSEYGGKLISDSSSANQEYSILSCLGSNRKETRMMALKGTSEAATVSRFTHNEKELVKVALI